MEEKNYKYVTEKFNIFETDPQHAEVNIFRQKLCLVLLCFLICFYIPVVNKSFSKACLNSQHKTLKTKTNNCSLNNGRVYVHVCFPIFMQSTFFCHNLFTHKKPSWAVFVWLDWIEVYKIWSKDVYNPFYHMCVFQNKK